MEQSDSMVLILGQEPQLIKALYELGQEVWVWSPKRIKKDLLPFVSRHIHSSFEKESDELKDLSFAAVIPVGEKGVLPAARLRQRLGIEGDTESFVSVFRDKYKMKTKVQEVDVAQTPFCLFEKGMELKELVQKWGLPLVIKHRQTSGSRGLVISKDPKELEQAIGRDRLVEKYIDGAEFSVESFVYKGEIIFTNITEYFVKKHINIAPGNLGDELRDQVLDVNKQVLKLFEMGSGMTHLEVYIREDKVYFGEVALRPPGGFIMELLGQVYGMDPWKVYAELMLGQRPEIQQAPKAFAAACIFHPGAGELQSRGLYDQLSAVPECLSSRFKMQLGDMIEKREGLGQNIGHLILKTESRERLLELFQPDEALGIKAV